MCSHLFINWLRNKTRWTPYIYHFLGEITICPLERQIYTLIYKGLRWYYTNKQCSLMNKIFISNELYARVKNELLKFSSLSWLHFSFLKGRVLFTFLSLQCVCRKHHTYGITSSFPYLLHLFLQPISIKMFSYFSRFANISYLVVMFRCQFLGFWSLDFFSAIWSLNFRLLVESRKVKLSTKIKIANNCNWIKTMWW